MARFSWTQDLTTGNSLIDSDHRRLVELVNALFETMERGQGGARMAQAMSDLIACTGEHFAREEAEMERIGYVASLAHRGEHVKLLQQAAELKAVLDAGGKINVPAVAEFLGTWLHDHILAADMKLAAALAEARSAEPAAQAH